MPIAARITIFFQNSASVAPRRMIARISSMKYVAGRQVLMA